MLEQWTAEVVPILNERIAPMLEPATSINGGTGLDESDMPSFVWSEELTLANHSTELSKETHNEQGTKTPAVSGRASQTETPAIVRLDLATHIIS